MNTFYRQLISVLLVLCFSLAISSLSNAAPSSPEPTSTFAIVPTITPSGPYYGRTRDLLKDYFKNLPAKVGPFKLIAYEQNFDMPIHFTLKDVNDTEYGMNIWATIDAQSAHFALARDGGEMQHPQFVNLGDEALVNAQAVRVIAALRYRNMIVEIEKGGVVLDPSYLTPIPPTNDQLIAALRDIYIQMLVPSVPTITPIPPTRTIPPPTQTFVAQFNQTFTPSGPLLNTDEDYIKKVFDDAPKTIGGFPVQAKINSDGISFSFKNSDGTDYAIVIYFSADVAGPYSGYNALADTFKDARPVSIGDQAVLNGQNGRERAVMRFRNIFVYVTNIDAPTPANQVTATPVPLTDAQLTAILSDVYAYILLPNVPTTTPTPSVTATQTAIASTASVQPN